VLAKPPAVCRTQFRLTSGPRVCSEDAGEKNSPVRPTSSQEQPGLVSSGSAAIFDPGWVPLQNCYALDVWPSVGLGTGIGHGLERIREMAAHRFVTLSFVLYRTIRISASVGMSWNCGSADKCLIPSGEILNPASDIMRPPARVSGKLQVVARRNSKRNVLVSQRLFREFSMRFSAHL